MPAIQGFLISLGCILTSFQVLQIFSKIISTSESDVQNQNLDDLGFEHAVGLAGDWLEFLVAVLSMLLYLKR